MTVTEFSNEFDIYYNNIKSSSAPGIDEYEKSVFLTNAQEVLVRNTYNPTEDGTTFEDTEAARRKLDKLIKSHTSVSPISSSERITTNAVFFTIPEDVLFITQEQLLILSPVACNNNKYIDVYPIRQDEFNLQKRNPFRKPSVKKLNKTAWRLDYGNVNNNRVVEIVYPENTTPNQYKFRYLRKIKPIILTDLTDIDENLSINGYTEVSTSEIDSDLHREILLFAVTMAKSIYDPKQT